MDYIEKQFNVRLNDLTFDRVKEYFQEERTESNFTEFKSFNSISKIENQYENLCIAICAMLNSEGGFLIWGAPIGKKKENKKEKIFQGNATPITPIQEHDKLISKIHFNIEPLPNGISVNIIENEDNSGCICVFEIQKSIYAPHQTSGKYWMRLDGQSITAPHHYVEALMKQIKYPNIQGFIKFIGFRYEKHFGGYLDIEISLWNLSPFQNEESLMYILYASPGEFMDESYKIRPGTERDGVSSKLVHNNVVDILHYGIACTVPFSVNYHDSTMSQGDILYFELQFGGKYSPVKKSTYRLLFDNPRKFKDVNSAIISKEENILESDLQLSDSSQAIDKRIADYLNRSI